MDNVLIIFTKAPIAGLAKTRLFPHLRFEEAAELQKALLADTVDKALAVPGTNVCIAYTPAKSLNVFKDLYGDRITNYISQEGADLGERMNSAFESAFEVGAKKAAIVGSDIPTLPPCYICAAFRQLGDADVVLGPAADGGYYLIALKRPAPELFRELAWSGPDVFKTAMSRAEALGLSVSCLPPLQDVDTFDDLKGLFGTHLPPNTSRIVSAIEANIRSRHDWLV